MSTTDTKSRARFYISRYIGIEASGSDISNPAADSGYDTDLTAELARVGTKGGSLRLTREGLLDLAEFLDAMELAAGQGGNPSGARSCSTHARRARELAAVMEPNS